MLEVSQLVYGNTPFDVAMAFHKETSVAFVLAFEEFVNQRALGDGELFGSLAFVRVLKTIFEG